MKYFTKAQIEEIRKQLATLGVRDTDLPNASELSGDEIVAIVQDGINKKVGVRKLIHDYLPDDIADGEDGKSAYEIWREQPGNANKTVADFLEAIRGERGADGINGTNGTNGAPGATGAAAGFGAPTASVTTDSSGQVGVNVRAFGPDTAKIFEFVFKNLGSGGGGGGSDYTLEPATQSALGGICIGYTELGDGNYAVKLNGDSQAYVTVPSGSGGTPGPIGPTGPAGPQGEDGVSVSDMKYLFKAGDSPTLMNLPSVASYPTLTDLANAGWVVDSGSITLTTSLPYLWCFLRITYSDNTVSHVGPWCVRYLNQELNIDYQEVADRVIGQIDSDLANIKSRLNDIDGPNSTYVHENGLTQVLNSYVRYDDAGNGVSTFRGFADAVFNAEEASIKASAGSEFVDRLAGANLSINGIASALSAAATKQELNQAISDARTEWSAEDASITSSVTKAHYIWYNTSTEDIYEYNHFNKTSNETFAQYEARVIAQFGKNSQNQDIIELRLIADEMSAIKQGSDNILLAVGDGTNVAAAIQLLKNASTTNGTSSGSKIILDANTVEVNGTLATGIVTAATAKVQQLAADQINAMTIVADKLTTQGGNNSSITMDDGFITFRDDTGRTRIIMGQGANDSMPVLKFYDGDGTPASGSTQEILGTFLYDLGPAGIMKNGYSFTPAEWESCTVASSSTQFNVGDTLAQLAFTTTLYKYTDSYRFVEAVGNSGVYAIQYTDPFASGGYSGTHSALHEKYFKSVGVLNAQNYLTHYADAKYYMFPLGAVDEDEWPEVSGGTKVLIMQISIAGSGTPRLQTITYYVATLSQSGSTYEIASIAAI